jgi:hypothetical protein
MDLWYESGRFYRQRLKGYRFFRALRGFVAIPAVETAVLVLIAIPCLLLLLGALPFLYWRAKRELAELRAMYANKHGRWNSDS